MLELFYIALFLAVLFDHRLNDRKNNIIFPMVLRLPRWFAFLGAAIGAGLLFFPRHPLESLASFILVFIVPVYFYLRRRFLNIVDRQYTQFSLVSDAVGVFMCWVYGMCVYALVTKAFQKIFTPDSFEMLDILISVVYSAGLIVVLIVRPARRFSGQGLWVNLGMHGNQKSGVVLYLVPALGAIVFATMSAWIVLTRKVQPQTPLTEMLESADSPVFIMVLIFLAVFMAPVVEEITFRGYYFRVAKELWGKRIAVLLITLVFAGLHVPQYWGDWAAIFMVAALGFVLTALRAWTGSTIASVTMHFVYNAGATIIPVLYLVTTNPAYFQFVAYEQQLNTQEKIALLEENVHKNPDFVHAHYDLANLYLQERTHYEEALALIDHTLSIDENNLDYLDTKAEILHQMGRVEESRETRERMMVLEEEEN